MDLLGGLESEIKSKVFYLLLLVGEKGSVTTFEQGIKSCFLRQVSWFILCLNEFL